MSIAYVDTNVFIRYFTKDHPELARKAGEFLDQVIEGKQEIVVLDTVIAEIIYVLTSKRLYGLSRLKASKMVESLVGLKSVRLSNKRRMVRALELYAQTKFDFVDCLLVANVESVPEAGLCSFEQGYQQFEQIRVVRI